MEGTRHRKVCWTCHRPQSVCYCHLIHPFSSNPVFAILIHPKEYFQAVGTARMAHLCLSNSFFITGDDFSHNDRVNHLIQDEEYSPFVLYPGDHAVNIYEHPRWASENLFPPRQKALIFVIDGTWRSARKILYQSENLMKLPQICFTPEEESRYRIRKQPKSHCVSTIEAIHTLLDYCHTPEHQSLRLLKVFDWMVDRQIEHRLNPTHRHTMLRYNP